MSSRAKRLFFCACAGLAVLVLIISRTRSTGQVAAYFGKPVPESIRIVGYESHDWYGLNPEALAYLRFTGNKEDIDGMIARAGFELKGSWEGPSPGGPDWWGSPHLLSWKARFYSRKHPPSGNGWEIGENRYWDELLAVDETGTNVFLLVWGI